MFGARPEPFRLGRRLRHGGLDFIVGDEADIAHGLQHDLRPLFRRLRIACRRKARGRFKKPGEHGRLAQIDVARGFVEVAPRGRLDAIGVGAEIDAIEIHRENLVLGEFMLQPEGQQHFLNFAFQRAIRREEQVFRELLRQRRAALHGSSRQHIRDDGASETERIDPEMRIKPPVLNGHDGLRNIGRHIFQRERLAAGGAAIGQHAAIHRNDLHIRRAFGNGPAAGARHARAVIENETCNTDAAPDAEYDAPIDEGANEARRAAAGAAGALFFFPGFGSAGCRLRFSGLLLCGSADALTGVEAQVITGLVEIPEGGFYPFA